MRVGSKNRTAGARSKIFLSVAAALLALTAPGWIDIARSDWARRLGPGLSPQALGHYEYVKRHLREPFRGYTRAQTLIPGFRVIALSHMACGLANVAQLDASRRVEALSLIEETIRRALSAEVAPSSKFLEEPKGWGRGNLYLSHLNLILGAYRAAGGDGRFDALHGRLSRYLSEASAREPDFTLASFGGADKWPADQAVTLDSLYAYDRAHGTHLSDKPIRGWLDFMKAKMTDPELGLHDSHFTAGGRPSRPRGCALSWSALYMAQFAPEEARRLYGDYRRQYFRSRLGLGGFREWPPGENRGMNADTGPIVLGIGFAASGLAIGPARLFGDRDAYAAMMRAGAFLGWPIQCGGRRSYLFAPLLGEAILFDGETATRWFQG
jgi:hypothetical protein